ncbi:MAG: AMIN domain-containing protein, partial [Elusimicrobia bacterium]|nr:AMIN domain-containing protein [Elusimicrobiota bacterium]
MKTRPLAILVSWAMLSAQLSNTAWAPSLSAEEPKGTVTTSLSPPPTPRSRVTLRDVQVQEDTVTIRASAPVKYQTFWLSEPRRLVIDLLNTELDWQKKALTVKGPLIQRVR